MSGPRTASGRGDSPGWEQHRQPSVGQYAVTEITVTVTKFIKTKLYSTPKRSYIHVHASVVSA